MERAQQQSLFRTGKDRESKVRQIDRVNQHAAWIILDQRQGGLMEEWARAVLDVSPSASGQRSGQSLTAVEGSTFCSAIEP